MESREKQPKQFIKKISGRIATGCIFLAPPFMKSFLRLKWRYVVASVVLLALAGGTLVVWRANRALKNATQEVRSAENLRFTVSNLAPVSSNFSWISAPAAFTGAASFKGEVFVFGASVLFAVGSRASRLQP